MREPEPRPVAAPLARRLRDLREKAYGKITQERLGTALGGADPVSITTISMWENPAGGRIPPVHRLEAYALLFCTPRSFAAGEPRLLDPAALTGEENARRAALREELLRLRGAMPEVPGMWEFPDRDQITIVCGRLPQDRTPPQADPADLDYVRMARFADLDTLVDVYGAVKAGNPDAVVILTTAREMTRVDALNHLILVGNTELNLAGRWFARHLELPVTVGDTTVRAGDRTYTSTLDDGGELIEDVGVFVRGPHPSAPHRTLTMCDGITTRGVRGAAQAFLNPTVRARNARWAATTFPPDTTYCVVLRVPVLNGEPLPQNLEDPAARLFVWPRP